MSIPLATHWHCLQLLLCVQVTCWWTSNSSVKARRKLETMSHDLVNIWQFYESQQKVGDHVRFAFGTSVQPQYQHNQRNNNSLCESQLETMSIHCPSVPWSDLHLGPVQRSLNINSSSLWKPPGSKRPSPPIPLGQKWHLGHCTAQSKYQHNHQEVRGHLQLSLPWSELH